MKQDTCYANVDQMKVFVMIRKGGMRINAGVNVKN